MKMEAALFFMLDVGRKKVNELGSWKNG